MITYAVFFFFAAVAVIFAVVVVLSELVTYGLAADDNGAPSD